MAILHWKLRVTKKEFSQLRELAATCYSHTTHGSFQESKWLNGIEELFGLPTLAPGFVVDVEIDDGVAKGQWIPVEQENQ